tara:strand:- start:17 stop:463 length:447 start_codon:yes stop_codon:yes gene_type:complete
MAFKTHALLVTTLLLTSVTAFAQQETLEAMQPQTTAEASPRLTSAGQSAGAARLATAIDAYNTRPNPGAVAPSAVNADAVTNTPATPAARHLAFEIRAYNGELRPVSDTTDYSNSPDRQALALGREITRFNQTGGSLDAVGQSRATIQ